PGVAQPRDAGWSSDPAHFDARFAALFENHFARLFRIMDRLSGDPALAADVAQDAFVRLYHRGAMPDTPAAWLISVAMNLFRNAKSGRSRRLRLLDEGRADAVLSDAPASPDEVADAARTRERVRAALKTLGDRERSLLLLRAEGYAYREIAIALELNEASIGTLLARARQAFREAYEP
ncbi:MAG: sigma-70 family RNA polymerase sigma factor, partial [Gemmatimonadetes bacterium]|nr:sigma-70 family RNA polymerase sigma factor [Gemmatimonadota bacterium]